MIALDISSCARCGGLHAALEFEELLQPVIDGDGSRWTHWASCPTTLQPILMKIEVYNTTQANHIIPRGVGPKEVKEFNDGS